MTVYANYGATQNLKDILSVQGVQTMWGGTSTNSGNAYSVTASPVPVALTVPMTVRFVASAANTGAATLNVNGLGAKSLTKSGSTALSSGDIASGSLVTATYDGTQWQIVTGAGSSSGGSGATGGAAVFGRDTFSPDGVQTSFVLSSAPAAAALCWPHIQGIYQNENAWTLSGSTLTFNEAPPAGSSSLVVDWASAGTSTSANATVKVYAAGTDFTAGSTTSLTLPVTPATKQAVSITFDGLKQHSDTWSLSGAVVTFTSTIPTGTVAVEVAVLSTMTIASLTDGIVTDSKLAVTPNTANGLVKLDSTGKLPAVDGSQLTGISAAGKPAFKNMLIGGDFSTNPWQRGTSFSGLMTTNYTADRFFLGLLSIGSGAFNVTQVIDAPTFAQSGVVTANSLKVTVGTAATGVGAGTMVIVTQPIEASIFGSLGYGASTAQTATLSFWVKSSISGTYSASMRHYSAMRSYPVNFTITNQNTWEKKTITIPGDTSGTWPAWTNAGAAVLDIVLHAGDNFKAVNATWTDGNYLGTSGNSNGFVTTLNATFQLALVQLEVGSSASAFEALPADVVLGRCKRYFEALGRGTDANQPFGAAAAFSSTVANAVVKYDTKRTAPTITYSAAGDFRVSHAAGNSLSVTGISSGGGQTGLEAVVVQFTVSSGLTSLQACNIIGNSSAARLNISAEL